MRPFALGTLQVASPLIMAPLAGYTSSSFRQLVREAGARLVFSEAISAKGLIYQSSKTYALIRFTGKERPIGIQFFTSNPEDTHECIKIIEAFRPDVVDLNLGCPAPKIIKKGEGGALLRDPPRALAVIRSACNATSLPVTVKLRLLRDLSLPDFIDYLKKMEDRGIAGITLHARTVAEGFRNSARWDLLDRIAEALSVPLIASGDIKCASNVKTVLETGCAGAMIGRAAVGNPFIFRHIARELETGTPAPPARPGVFPRSTVMERIAVCIRHLELLAAEKGAESAVKEIRKQLAPYLRGHPQAKKAIRRLITIDDKQELQHTLEELLQPDPAL